MKVLGVESQVAGLRGISGKKSTYECGFRCDRYELQKDSPIISDWAQKVCQQLLSKTKIAPDQIGVIIQSSVCLYGTTSHSNTSAPGLGYQIQKHLQAEKAFVFDMFHSDWGNMIFVAEKFLLRSGLPFALLLQANQFSNVSQDHENGFCLPDAVSAIVLKQSNERIQLSNITLKSHHSQYANFLFNRNKETYLEQELFFSLQWSYDEGMIQEINHTYSHIVNQLNSQRIEIVSDQWFSQQGVQVLENIDRQSGGRLGVLGMHTIPKQLQTDLEQGHLPSQLGLVSFNPFLLYFSILTMVS